MSFDIKRLWRADSGSQRPTLTVPFISDCDNWHKTDEVKAICQRAAKQLADHLFRWDRQWPARPRVVTWDHREKRFLGMDMALFQERVMGWFTIKTPDGREWALDRAVAALIMEDRKSVV